MTDELRSDLDRPRREHRLRHAEAQMVLPDTVAETASTASRQLAEVYGLLMRLDGSTARQDTAMESFDKQWDPLRRMRQSCVSTSGSRHPAQTRRATHISQFANRDIVFYSQSLVTGSRRRAHQPWVFCVA
ncbi:hypothetical protein [Streptomyces smyrnaeus]|uniref:hypothetical protein n=1 Tax=Streptomyces smyrnaeus TaxID=1387713 RepID=UPI0036C2FFE0